MERIENVKNPRVGETYLVPCVHIRQEGKITVISPVINHPHTDLENGQPEAHYHQDTRFSFESAPSGYEIRGYSRITKTPETIIEYLGLKLECLWTGGVSPVVTINKSVLKHKCLDESFLCPHRGYDLINIVPCNGIIICPLHGLRFDAITKQLLNDPSLCEN